MYVNWKALSSFGIVFWGLLLFSDLLAECSWKQHSEHLKLILNSAPMKRSEQSKEESVLYSNPSTNHPINSNISWSVLIWNMFGFICALVFCSILKSTSWIIWRIIKIYNLARNRKTANEKLTNNDEALLAINNEKSKYVFKNQLYTPSASPKQTNILNEHNNMLDQIEELRKERVELKNQLSAAQRENFETRQQMEEFKLETIMLQEKLTRSNNSLKENLKMKDSQEVVERKAHNLEVHLKEVSRDRDNLRSKLSMLEKKYAILEERVRDYEKHETESNLEHLPEKDMQQCISTSEAVESSPVTDAEVDMSTFQKRIQELQKNLQGAKDNFFNSNSKISVDLDESSVDYSGCMQKDGVKPDINKIKENIINYNAYKVQMLRPKLKLCELKQKMCHTDTTGSSSDECSTQRLISGRADFKNFLKTLSSNTSINYQ